MALSSSITAVLTVALLVAAATVAEGQQDCATKLVPCLDYINSTSPPPSCCNAIREVVTNQLDCLCRLYRTPGLLAGINVTQALMLPKHCNVPGDISACNALAPGASSMPPPGVPGGGNDNAGGRISWMGIPALLLVSALTYFY